MWVGLTGGIASGKSTVSKLIQKYGIPVIDADLIAHQVVEPGTPGLQKVILRFGMDFLSPDGTLDRMKLASLVFRDQRMRLELESILHPLVQAEVQAQKEQLQKKSHRVIFYDVPLLFEKKMEKNFDAVLLVSCSEALQKERLKNRDGLDDFEIESRIRSQLPLAKKKDRAQFHIENNGTEAELEQKVVEVLSTITNKPIQLKN